MESEVISVRLEKGIKEELEKEGIDLPHEFKEYIKRRVALLRQKETIEEIAEVISKRMKPSKKGFAASFVRHERDAGH